MYFGLNIRLRGELRGTPDLDRGGRKIARTWENGRNFYMHVRREAREGIREDNSRTTSENSGIVESLEAPLQRCEYFR